MNYNGAWANYEIWDSFSLDISFQLIQEWLTVSQIRAFKQKKAWVWDSQNAAKKVFFEQGFKNTTMESIDREAGIGEMDFIVVVKQHY